MSSPLRKIGDKAKAASTAQMLWEKRAQDILDAQNEPAKDFILDDWLYQGLICPRRSGKSFSCTSKALYHGEKYPGSRILIISLTLKSTRENYWSSAPGGIFTQNARFGLNLRFNSTNFEWFHENGSHGQLVGAETMADLEKIRGALAEADLVIVDECKSFAAELLETLLRDVLEPGLMTRNGKLVLAGTPGSIPMGKFYEATSLKSRLDVEVERFDEETGETKLVAEKWPTCFPFRERESETYRVFPREDMWSLHTWTIKDNRKSNPRDPEAAWRRALSIKRRNKWGDDHPTWRREFLGEWVTDVMDLVYAYAAFTAKCQWNPPRRGPLYSGSPTGLPEELGPWHLIMGLDFGFEDDCACVLAAWSEQTQELRQIYDYKEHHLLPDQFAVEILRVIDDYGMPDVIVGDRGGTGITYIETLNQRYGLSVIAAEKREKFDFIEFMNADFHSGMIKVIPGSSLHLELMGLQWDLSKDTKTVLARKGALKEDPACANHLCDAFLYLWRYAYHYWAKPKDTEPTRGTTEWVKREMDRQVACAVARKAARTGDPMGLKKVAEHSAPPGATARQVVWRTP